MHLVNFRTFLLAVAVVGFPYTLHAQGDADEAGRSIQIDPPRLTLEVGESATLRATVRDESGEVIPARVVFLTRARRSLTVDQDGVVEAHAPGEFSVSARVPGGGGEDFLTANVEVVVPFPPLARIEVRALPQTVYTGTLVRPDYRVYDVTGELRDEALRFESSNESVVTVDVYGQLTPISAGTASLQIRAGELSEDAMVRVETNPVQVVTLAPAASEARTGDVIRFVPALLDANGAQIEGVPVLYSVDARSGPEGARAPSASIAQDGRFVAETPGQYTIIAHVGTAFSTATIEIVPRGVQREVEVLGRGAVRQYHSSDLWVWEGADGRDYAMTGTWGGNGEAYVWDVTEPENILRIDTVEVDARTVNDVKVSGDGQLAVITREGASDRRNGIVLLDVSDPAAVTRIAAYDDRLTGGVHNAFFHENYVYAVNNGTRYDVINVGEPSAPFRVASFELETPGHSVHDVWIEDGIAYSSNWSDGVVLADVGNGIAGGAPDRPVEFASWQGVGGDTHAAFPFRSQSTGRFYVIVGDESFPSGFNSDGPTVPAGYMHIVDFTDFDNPVEVARFEVPEAGSHNIWIEGDVLYAAFYNAGLRIVDLSGELMGDLYRQGREIARFVPKDPLGVVPNESMVWGAQPHKGVVYVSDYNSGLWAIRIEPAINPAGDGN